MTPDPASRRGGAVPAEFGLSPVGLAAHHGYTNTGSFHDFGSHAMHNQMPVKHESPFDDGFLYPPAQFDDDETSHFRTVGRSSKYGSPK